MGTISAAGLYTAPGTISAAQTVTVTATSAADPTKSASAAITVVGMKSQDLNSDGAIDVRDLALLARAYGKTSTDSAWATYSAADLNWDNIDFSEAYPAVDPGLLNQMQNKTNTQINDKVQGIQP